MINADRCAELEDCQPYAPKRLVRKDVAAIRDLYRRAWRAQYQHKTWSDGVTICLSRDPVRRAVAKLGSPVAAVTVKAAWSLHQELGLDVQFHAHMALGRDQANKIFIGKHRFRRSSSETQFCREVARMVRLGLGWLRFETTTLKVVLR